MLITRHGMELTSAAHSVDKKCVQICLMCDLENQGEAWCVREGREEEVKHMKQPWLHLTVPFKEFL